MYYVVCTYIYIYYVFLLTHSLLGFLTCDVAQVSLCLLFVHPELQLSFSFRVRAATPTQAVACVAPQAHSGRSQLTPRWSGEQRHTNSSYRSVSSHVRIFSTCCLVPSEQNPLVEAPALLHYLSIAHVLWDAEINSWPICWIHRLFDILQDLEIQQHSNSAISQCLHIICIYNILYSVYYISYLLSIISIIY